MKQSTTTRHIDGKIYHFFPMTTTAKAEAEQTAGKLREKGYKARVFKVYSTWNKRWQYEIFTNPAYKRR